MPLKFGPCKGILVLLSLGWPTLAKPVTLTVTRPVCNDPAREQLEEAWRQGGGHGWHDSLYNVGKLYWHLTDLHFQNVPREYVAVRTYHLGPSSCPQDANRTESCPSYDVINYDPNRIPVTLFEKRCSCERCGAGFLRPGNSKMAMGSCQEMRYPTRVLRRVNCVYTTFIYQVIIEPLIVGCYCESADTRFIQSPIHNY